MNMILAQAAAGEPETTTVITSGGFREGGGAMVMLIFFFAIGIGINVFMVICWCNIVKKLGHPWAMGLIALIPLVGLIHVMILAFSQSPNQTRIRQLKRQIKQLEDTLYEGGGAPQQQAQQARQPQRGGRSRGRPSRQPAQDRHADNDPGDAASALDDLAG